MLLSVTFKKKEKLGFSLSENIMRVVMVMESIVS